MKNNFLNNWIKSQTIPHFAGVQVIASNFVAERSVPRHVHHGYNFSLAINGASKIDCGHCGETHVFKSGDLFLTEAHEVYAARTIGKPPWFGYTISISKELLAFLLNFASGGKQIALPHYAAGAVKNDELRRLFLELHDSLNVGQSKIEQESLLLDWVISVQQSYGDQSGSFDNRRLGRETAAIRRVRDFIAENLTENIRLRDLANLAGLSPFHLNRVFTKKIGVPPHVFQNQLKIEHAQKLIRENKPFSEIALESGFADQSHFNRFFKRYTGITPKNFFAG